jgi:hypothetical protein
MRKTTLITSRRSSHISLVVLLQVFALVAVTSLAAADTGRLVVSLYPGEYEIVQDLNGQRIEMENFGQLMDPGKPLLPMKRFQILLPPGARALSVDVIGSSANELPVDYDIEPFIGILPLLGSPRLEEGIARLNEEWQVNHDATYLSDSPYPHRIAWLSGAGTLRKYSYASVAFCPITYHPISRRLVHHDRVDVAIDYTLPDKGSAEAERIERLLADCVADERAQQLFLNYRELVGEYTAGEIEAPRDGPYDYVIITTSDLIGSVTSSDFPAWKAELTHNLKTVLITDPEIAGQPGYDLAEQIRNFLREYYGPWGIEYVLLVGDYATVPMRICYPDPSYHVYDPSDPGLFAPGTPTDHYYADLSYPDSESWDLDGDGYLGEYTQDLPDFLPEVYVGRIPVNDTDRITHTLNKSVTFEQDGGSWKKNVLHPTSILFFENQDYSGYPFIDGAAVIDSIETGLMDGWNITHMSEQYGLVTSLFPWPAVSQGAFSDHWRNGQHAVVNWSGHGWSHDVCRTVWGWDNGNGVPERANGELTNISLINLTTILDDDHPSVVFAVSCNVGYPEPNAWGNLGIDLATEPGWGAAVGMVSASRPSAISADWRNSPGGAEQICFDFNRYLVSEGRNVGVALYDGKYDATTIYGWEHLFEYANVYNVNLYGDPSLRVAGYPTGVEDEQTDSGAVTLSLLPAYPNPFNPRTSIRFSLAEAGPARLTVHDVAGRRVATLLDRHLTAGEHSLEWDGRGPGDERLASGIYFIKLAAGGTGLSCRVTLLK